MKIRYYLLDSGPAGAQGGAEPITAVKQQPPLSPAPETCQPQRPDPSAQRDQLHAPKAQGPGRVTAREQQSGVCTQPCVGPAKIDNLTIRASSADHHNPRALGHTASSSTSAAPRSSAAKRKAAEPSASDAKQQPREPPAVKQVSSAFRGPASKCTFIL